MAKIVASGSYEAILGKRINDKDFVVNDGEASLQYLLLPAFRDYLVVQSFGGEHARVLLNWRLLTFYFLWLCRTLKLIIKTLRSRIISDTAANEEPFVLP